MSGSFLQICAGISLVVLTISFFVITIRIVRGPTLPDRVLALDMLVAVGIGFIAAIAIRTGYYLYIDVAISLGLVGFLATIAFARYILHRGDAPENEMKMMIGQPQKKDKD